jgi:BirA family biotin operon repressor/biotin-[acetyl-CoA-carboxylase] ligase
VEAITGMLTTSYLGRPIIYKPVTGSTNDDARLLAGQEPAGTVVLAEVQTGGKGRLGRRWESPAGGVFISVVLRPEIPAERAPLLAIVAGYAVASAIRALTSLDTRVKWPNDVLVAGKKVCGILCEAAIEPGTPCAPNLRYVICGIGINANQVGSDFPPSLRETASSIRILMGGPIDRNLLIATVLNEMEVALGRFNDEGLAGMRDDLAGLWAFLDRDVCLQNRSSKDSAKVTGRFRGVDDTGRALIEIPGEGVVPFSAGDLSLRPLL